MSTAKAKFGSKNVPEHIDSTISEQDGQAPIRPKYSKKRSAVDIDLAEPEETKRPKVEKVHTFFSNATATAESSTFQWLKPSLGPQKTCFHGTNLAPESRTKVAAFDLDGVLINAKKAIKGAPPQWDWWRAMVPGKLKEVHEAGYSIVIVSNQALQKAQLNEWLKKIPLIAGAIPEVPFRIFAATARDQYRKPMPGIWHEVERIFAQDNVTIDKTQSFFVGDAAGRQKDFASTDRKWALNLDLPFFTPEQYFLGLPAEKFTLPGFSAASLPSLPPVTPTMTPIIPTPTKHGKPEVVLFFGYPCLGKSTFYRQHFQPAGYVHVNQDTLKTRDKCIKVVNETLAAGHSCVVDNTNRDVQTRRHYIEAAKKAGASIRCFFFTGSYELARHNNFYRAYNMPAATAAEEPSREVLPPIAFTSFRDNHEPPELSEGFAEIKTVNWSFTGDDEARSRWSMWLQVDGK